MSCGTVSPETQEHVATYTTTNDYHWFTGWMPACALLYVMATLKVKNVTGNFQCQLVLQTAATRTDNPDTPNLIDTLRTGAGEYCSGVEDISQYTDDKFFVRFGIAYNLSSGSALGAADVAFQISTVSCGKVVGAQTLYLASSTTSDAGVAITGWIPRIIADKLMAAIVFRSKSGNFQWKFAKRGAGTSIQNPGGWVALSGETSYRTTEGETNSGELTVGDPDEMWVQFGVIYSSSSGAGSASLDLALAVRRT